MESRSSAMGGSDGRAKNHNWGVKWTPDEDARLFEAMERFGAEDWKNISAHVATRDLVQCNQRWEKVLRPDLVKGKWTEQEDDLLRFHVMQGFEHWGDIAAKLPGRTSKQCRERWCNYLDPGLLRTPFTSAEDEQLCNLQRQLGNKWSAIARQMPGRTENTVKLRYNALVKAAANGRPLPSTFRQKRKYSEDVPDGEDFTQGSSQPAFLGEGRIGGSAAGTVSPTASSPAASVLSAATTLAAVSAISLPVAAASAAASLPTSASAHASAPVSAHLNRSSFPAISAPTGMTTGASLAGQGAHMLPPSIPIGPAKRLKFADIDFFTDPSKVDELIQQAAAGPVVHPAYSQLGYAPYGAAPYGAAPPPAPVVLLPPYLMHNGMFYATAAYRHQLPMHLAAGTGTGTVGSTQPPMPHMVSPYAQGAQRPVHVVGHQRSDEPRSSNRG